MSEEVDFNCCKCSRKGSLYAARRCWGLFCRFWVILTECIKRYAECSCQFFGSGYCAFISALYFLNGTAGQTGKLCEFWDR